MQFIEALRLLINNYSKMPLGGPHLLLADAMEIVNAKKANLFTDSEYYSELYDKIRDIPIQFGLADNGLTISSSLYQKAAKLIQTQTPSLIKIYDTGSLVFDSLIEADLVSNLQKLSPEVKTILGAQFYLAGISDTIRCVNKYITANYFAMDDIESGIYNLNEAQILLPDEKRIINAIKMVNEIKQAATTEKSSYSTYSTQQNQITTPDKSRKTLVILCIIGVFIVWAIFHNSSGSNTTQNLASAFVGKECNLRSTPSKGRNIIKTIPKGGSVTIIENSGEWSKVRYVNSEGYIKSSLLSSLR